MIDQLQIHRAIENAAKTGQHGDLAKLIGELDVAISEGHDTRRVIRLACQIVTEIRGLAAVAEWENVA